MLTTLFILCLIAIALWRPLIRVLIAALLALLVFAGIHIVRAIDAITTVSPHQISVETDTLDHRGG